MIELQQGAAIPVILALTEAVKRAGVPSKYAGLVSIIIGIAYGLILGGFTIDNGLLGLAFGLGASGAFSVTKAVIKKPKDI